MKIIGGSRRSGRTTRLIELCAQSEANGNPSYIVCHNLNEASRIFREAKSLNLDIAFPITYDELGSFHGMPTAKFKFFIDNGEYLLRKFLSSKYDIDTITITVDEVLMPKILT